MKSDIIVGKSTIIVDDHLLFTNGLTGILEDIGLKVNSTFSNAKDAITYLKNQNVSLRMCLRLVSSTVRTYFILF